MKQRFTRSLAVAALAVGLLLPAQRAEAVPPVLDPAGTVANAGFNARPNNASPIYMNRNQILVRITGCEYSARVTNVSNPWTDLLCDDGSGTNPRHWIGSGMGFVENIVNEQLLAATADTSTFGGVAPYDHLDPVAEPMFRNYVDLVLKRILDADTLTPVDFDPATFRMVDHFNPSTTLPVGLTCTGAAAPTARDTNCDGVEGGWEFGPFSLLSLGCVALPVIGDVCVNTYLINVDPNQRKQFGAPGLYPLGTTYQTAGGDAVPALTWVNNIAAPLVSFDSYDPNNQATTSHLFIAGQAQYGKSFDAEILGCDGPILSAESGTAGDKMCNANSYRDDDDGLYVELALTNFKLGLLFEPPFTDSAYGTSAESLSVYGAGANHRHSQVRNIRDIPENGVAAATFPCPDGTAITVVDESSTDYDPACDLSRYLKATGEAMIPLVRVGASLRIVSTYNYFAPVDTGPQTTTGYSITLGLELQSLELDAQFQFAFFAGPYCTDAVRGQDYTGVFYDRTDNPNNCQIGVGYDTNTIADDMTYIVSEQFTETFPWLRAELSGRFNDLFDPATNPGWFLGPTQLFDVASTLADLNFDHPVAATSAQWVTDAIYLQAMLDTNVDSPDVLASMREASGVNAYGPFANGAGTGFANLRGDNAAEFWADPWGVMIPLNASLGIYFAQGHPDKREMVSCVTADAAYTGYKDGYGPNTADDPYVSRPLPRLDMNWSGSGANWPAVTNPTAAVLVGTNDNAEYDSMLLHLKIPNVNGSTPFTNPTDLAAAGRVVPAPDTTNRYNQPVETYAFGLALHQNVLSKLLYEAVIDGLLCLDFDAYTGKEELQRTVGDLLTTDLFGFFVPYLSDQYPGAQMALRIIPLLQNPQGRGYLKSAADYPSKVSQYIGGFTAGAYDAAAGVTNQNPIPRIMTGGINQYDALKRRFTGEIESLSIQDFWPDLSIVIPHLLAEFYVWDDSGGTPVRKRAFALDLGVNVGLNIDIIQDISRTAGTQAPTPLEAGGFPIARPTYAGTDFPIGCRDDLGPNFPYPCEITGVPSRWVLFLGGLLDPELNAVLVYDEMAFAITDFAGAVSYPGGLQNAGPDGGYGSYEAAISNLIGVLLSGELAAFAEIGIDLAALVNLPIVITVPYIGPSFVWNDSTSNVVPNGANNGAGAYGDGVECGEEGVVGVCHDPVINTTGGVDIARDVSDNDLNGFGDYLVVAAGIDLSYLTSNYLLRFIDSFLEPMGTELIDGLALGYEYCDGLDADDNPAVNLPCISETFNNTLLDLVGGLGGAPAAYGARQGFPRGYESPETIIKGVHKAHALETLIEFEGWHPSVPASQLTFSYRVNGGLWTPFVPASGARIPGLLEGRHVFEVRAKDPKGNVEYTPERIEFVVDSVAPRIAILGDRVQSGRANFSVDVRDAQSLPEDIRVSWRLNDGSWSEYSARKDVRFQAPVGQHTLQVRAMDEAGNVGLSTLTVAIEDGGFGCAVSTGTGTSGLLDLAVLLLLPALVVLRRRRA